MNKIFQTPPKEINSINLNIFGVTKIDARKTGQTSKNILQFSSVCFSASFLYISNFQLIFCIRACFCRKGSFWVCACVIFDRNKHTHS